MARDAAVGDDVAATTDGRTPHVVVVGAGFAGLTATRRLAAVATERPLRVTLVDRNNHHTFQPLLYQVATAGLQPHDIGHSVRGILTGRRGRRLRNRAVRFRMGRVADVDLDARTLRFGDGATLDYDLLVLAAGAATADYDIPGVLEHGFPLKTLPEALALRNHVLARFEDAANDPARIDDGTLRFVVAGGGPTGVELAGALVELIAVLAKDHPGAAIDRCEVVVVEMLDTLLAPYPERLRRYTADALRARGVVLRLGTAIERVAPDHVVLAGGERLRTRTLIWTAGVRANPLADRLGLEQSGGGRLVVDDHLRAEGRPDVFAIGDVAAATDADGEPLPQLAPVALQQGRFVADQVRRTLDGRPLERFRYVDKGTMATIGRHDAVVQLPFGIRFTGTPAWLSWLFLHLLYLVGFRNRVAVFLNWLWNYVTYDRAARLIVAPEGLDGPDEELQRPEQEHGPGGPTDSR